MAGVSGDHDDGGGKQVHGGAVHLWVVVDSLHRSAIHRRLGRLKFMANHAYRHFYVVRSEGTVVSTELQQSHTYGIILQNYK